MRKSVIRRAACGQGDIHGRRARLLHLRIQPCRLLVEVSPKPQHQCVECLNLDVTRFDARAFRFLQKSLDAGRCRAPFQPGLEQAVGERIAAVQDTVQNFHDAGVPRAAPPGSTPSVGRPFSATIAVFLHVLHVSGRPFALWGDAESA